MARKSTAGVPQERGRKSDLMRQYLRDYPNLRNPEIAQQITALGVNCKVQDVANMRAKLKKAGLLATPDRALSIDDVLQLKAMVEQAGGLAKVEARVLELEAFAAKVGGLERLKRGLHALKRFAN